MWRTRSPAIAVKSRMLSPYRMVFPSAVTVLTTPGHFSASDVSMDTIVAWATVGRRIAQWSIPGSLMSFRNLALPVIFAVASGRRISFPMYLNSMGHPPACARYVADILPHLPAARTTKKTCRLAGLLRPGANPGRCARTPRAKPIPKAPDAGPEKATSRPAGRDVARSTPGRSYLIGASAGSSNAGASAFGSTPVPTGEPMSASPLGRM